MNPSLKVINRTQYSTEDLCRFFAKGLWAMRCRRDKVIKVLSTKGESRGIAYVGSCSPTQRGSCEGKSMVLMLPPPDKLTIRRLARLFEHEVWHLKGKRHEDMTEQVYWSSSPTTPAWARGAVVRWRFGQRLHSPSLDEREGKRLDRELATLPERSPTVRALRVPPGYVVDEVLAGAYRGGRANLRATQSHLVNEATGAVLCGSVDPDNMAGYSETRELTCPKCIARAQRMVG